MANTLNLKKLFFLKFFCFFFNKKPENTYAYTWYTNIIIVKCVTPIQKNLNQLINKWDESNNVLKTLDTWNVSKYMGFYYFLNVTRTFRVTLKQNYSVLLTYSMVPHIISVSVW